MAMFNLHNAIFYTPPRATGLQGTSQHYSRPASQQAASSPSEDAERNRPSEPTQAGTTTEPILVPSDSESDLDDDGDDNLDFDDSRSDATLLSIDTLATSVAKSQCCSLDNDDSPSRLLDEIEGVSPLESTTMYPGDREINERGSPRSTPQCFVDPPMLPRIATAHSHAARNGRLSLSK
ncbi:Fc.00g056130.m01.CDS01 [Cosmosporella sp. VM-42]